jgi:hypothetical protein
VATCGSLVTCVGPVVRDGLARRWRTTALRPGLRP